MGSRVILWDFDGTLARRDGMWAGCLLEVLNEQEHDHDVAVEQLRPHLASGFPWQDATRPHPELNEPEAWWSYVNEVFVRAFTAVGYDPADSDRLAAGVRRQFLLPERWQLFDDTLPTLEALSSRGWRHAIVSNHVPELPQLVDGLGLAEHFVAVVTSASVGFDKPHPRIFQTALEAAGTPSNVWMVGDSVVADIAGAEAVGIPAILVRRQGTASRRTDELSGVVDIIGDGP